MLLDSFERNHDYLRISVTDRCNLRCTYCMPPEGIELQPNERMLSFGEIVRLAELFVKLGVRKIRVTGGEPLVRNGIADLFFMLGGIQGLSELAVSTNGVLLSEKLPSLWQAGVSQLNISLDSLRPERFTAITRRENHQAVLSAIEHAVKFGIAGNAANHRGGIRSTGFRSIKINVVVMRGVNDDEILDFVRYCAKLTGAASFGRTEATERAPSVEVRFIEFMPFRSNSWSRSECVTYDEMLERIESEFTLEALESPLATPGPAKSYRVLEADCRIGFITAMSEHFCSSCNRLRLTADGQFRTCLFGTDEVSLRDLLRAGASDLELETAIRSALHRKWEAHPGPQDLVQINDREMVMIGG